MRLEMKYFVLKPRSKHKDDLFAKASRRAMNVYAYTIRREHPEFANAIDAWAAKEVLRAVEKFHEEP